MDWRFTLQNSPSPLSSCEVSVLQRAKSNAATVQRTGCSIWQAKELVRISSKPPGIPTIPHSSALSTIIRDDWFCADSSRFPLYFVTSFVWGGSEHNDFLLELQDWVRAGLISAGAGILIYFNMSAAEWQSKAWGD